jgi:hypothetical protein
VDRQARAAGWHFRTGRRIDGRCNDAGNGDQRDDRTAGARVQGADRATGNGSLSETLEKGRRTKSEVRNVSATQRRLTSDFTLQTSDFVLIPLTSEEVIP